MEISGLNTSEVNERIANGLVNTSAKTKTKTIGEIFVENVFSVFNYIIFSIIIAIIYFYYRSGDYNLLLDSFGVFTIAFLNTAIAIGQEIKAKRALDKVSLLLKKNVNVIRNGSATEIQQEEIVQDDVIVIKRGDQVVVDGDVISSNHLEIDESLLTGESIPIIKKDSSKLLSGSFCISGNGYYRAEKIGGESYANKVTELAKKYKFVVTPLQQKLNRIVQGLFAVALLLVLTEIFFDADASLDNVSFIRKLATILISLIPQGLVLMSSVTFALGVYRISKIGAIVQKLNAIESFSNVQIVCMDKTGTLTKNQLAVEQLIPVADIHEEKAKSLLGTYAKYSSDKNATIEAISNYDSGAFFDVIDELPFSSETKLSLLKVKNNGEEKVYILGGYDVLLGKVTPELRDKCTQIYEENGLKVFRNLLLGEVTSNFEFSNSDEYIGSISIKPLCLVSISDQVRDDVFDAIRLFERNGIKFKVLSGDNMFAIQAIVNKIGWQVNDDQMISGEELDKLDDSQFKDAVLHNLVFARLKPEHKLRIVKILRDEKLYTAMIGDGVNDLPAIKEADMGIAMEEGSQVTKEVADLVLLKNRFSLLPEIFNEGNKIVNTISSVAKLFLTKNFLVIYLSLFSLFFLWEFPLTPRRVALINIFTIGLPSFIIALRNLNTEKNRKFLTELFSHVIISALIIVVAGYTALFIAQEYFAVSERDANMIMLTVMILTAVSNYFSVALTKNNPNNNLYLIYGLLIISLFIGFALTTSQFFLIKFIKEFYEITNLNVDYWIISLAVGILFAVVLFVIQKLRKRFFERYIVKGN